MKINSVRTVKESGMGSHPVYYRKKSFRVSSLEVSSKLCVDREGMSRPLDSEQANTFLQQIFGTWYRDWYFRSK